MREFSETRRTFSRTISYHLLDYKDLDEKEQLMFDGALRARYNAQAPYSNYKVGAAVLSESGSIYIGCNVETADWRALHAEENAISSMVTWDGSAKIKKLAFVGAKAEEDIKVSQAKVPKDFTRFVNIPVPCGGCLQKIWENCRGDGSVALYSFFQSLGCLTRVTFDNAFPLRFGPNDLGVDYSKTARK